MSSRSGSGLFACCRTDYNKKLSKKPRHLELTDSPLDTPTGTPLPVYTPLDPPHQHRGPGRPSMRQGGGYGEAAVTAAPGSGGYEAKRPPGRPPGRCCLPPSSYSSAFEHILQNSTCQ